MTRALPVLIALLSLAPASATEACTPTSTEPTLDTGDHGVVGRYYVDYMYLQNAVWIYEESNGIDGLQRQDEHQDDTCDGMIPSDTLVW